MGSGKISATLQECLTLDQVFALLGLLNQKMVLQDSRRAKFNAPHGIAVAPRPPVGWTDTSNEQMRARSVLI